MRSGGGEAEACAGGGDELGEVLLEASGGGTTPRAGAVFAELLGLADEDVKAGDLGFGVGFGENVVVLMMCHTM